MPTKTSLNFSFEKFPDIADLLYRKLENVLPHVKGRKAILIGDAGLVYRINIRGNMSERAVIPWDLQCPCDQDTWNHFYRKIEVILNSSQFIVTNSSFTCIKSCEKARRRYCWWNHYSFGDSALS